MAAIFAQYYFKNFSCADIGTNKVSSTFFLQDRLDTYSHFTAFGNHQRAIDKAR